MVGKRGDYHEIASRFLLHEELFDTISFNKKDNLTDKFILNGNFNCSFENNTIYKAYKLLHTHNPKKVDEFFSEYSLNVDKNIPIGSGLGGGSSNAATALLSINKLANLNINFELLCEFGRKIGADVSFFLHNAKSANVSGIGENITPFHEKNYPKIELIFPDISCDTTKIYKTYREHFYTNEKPKYTGELLNMQTIDILTNYKNTKLNDLLFAVLLSHEELKTYAQKGLFLSGSGSTFFKVKK